MTLAQQAKPSRVPVHEGVTRGVDGMPFREGRLRDPNNTRGDLRKALDRAGFCWVTSHTFRRTVATRLDDAGLSARQIANHVGHSRPSLTQDAYLGRGTASPAAAAAGHPARSRSLRPFPARQSTLVRPAPRKDTDVPCRPP